MEACWTLGLAVCLLLGPLAGEGHSGTGPCPWCLPSILRCPRQRGSGLGCLLMASPSLAGARPVQEGAGKLLPSFLIYMKHWGCGGGGGSSCWGWGFLSQTDMWEAWPSWEVGHCQQALPSSLGTHLANGARHSHHQTWVWPWALQQVLAQLGVIWVSLPNSSSRRLCSPRPLPSPCSPTTQLPPSSAAPQMRRASPSPSWSSSLPSDSSSVPRPGTLKRQGHAPAPGMIRAAWALFQARRPHPCRCCWAVYLPQVPEGSPGRGSP